MIAVVKATKDRGMRRITLPKRMIKAMRWEHIDHFLIRTSKHGLEVIGYVETGVPGKTRVSNDADGQDRPTG